MQAQGLMSKPRIHLKKLGVLVCAWNPSSRETEIGRHLGLLGHQPTLSSGVAQWETPTQKTRFVWGVLGDGAVSKVFAVQEEHSNSDLQHSHRANI